MKMNFKRVFSLIAFLALAGFSCFWTSESLYLWLPMITRAGAWLITIAVYVFASWCFSRFFKAFEREEKFKPGLFSSRAGHLVGGFLGLFVSWIVFSLPTNTHTLLYRSSVKSVLSEELNNSITYLNDSIKFVTEKDAYSDSLRVKKIDGIISELNNHVAGLQNEFIHPDRKGFGPICKAHIDRIKYLMETQGYMFKEVTNIDGGRDKVNFVYKQVRDCIYDLEKQKAKIVNNKEVDKGRKEHLKYCNDALAQLNSLEAREYDRDVISNALKFNNAAYSFLKKNLKRYNSDEDKKKFTREQVSSDTDTMHNVPGVWVEFLFGEKYKGTGFGWFVLLAFMVDLMAFIFFNIAQKQEEDYN